MMESAELGRRSIQAEEMLPLLKRHEIQVLLRAGHSQADVATRTGASVDTVRRVKRESEVTKVDDAAERRDRKIGRPSKATPFAARVAEWLAEDPDLPTQELLRRAMEAGYTGQKTAFYALVAGARPPRAILVVRFEGLPGEFSQHDFGHVDVQFIDGRMARVHSFASRLKYSRFVAVTLVDNERTETIVRCLARDFVTFGGLPLLAVFDRPKTIVKKGGKGRDVEAWNATFAQAIVDIGVGVEMPTVAVTRPNERWSMDFVHDYLADGRKLRTFNVVDAFTRECLAIAVDTSLPARRILPVLGQVVWRHGLPESVRVDNGPEFISVAMENWAHQHGVKLDFIQPGKPTQNAHVESFNGRFRDECLAQAHFPTLARARVEIEEWRVDYNTERPHSALDYRTPKAFGDMVRCKVPPSAGAAAALFEGDVQRPARSRARQGVESRVEVNWPGIGGSTSGVRSDTATELAAEVGVSVRALLDVSGVGAVERLGCRVERTEIHLSPNQEGGDGERLRRRTNVACRSTERRSRSKRRPSSPAPILFRPCRVRIRSASRVPGDDPARGEPRAKLERWKDTATDSQPRSACRRCWTCQGWDGRGLDVGFERTEIHLSPNQKRGAGTVSDLGAKEHRGSADGAEEPTPSGDPLRRWECQGLGRSKV
jgi:transposase InsO family protein/transposase